MSRIVELASLDELDIEQLANLAQNLGISYAGYIFDYYSNDNLKEKRTALAYEIRKKLGYFDVMCDFSHVDISHLPSAIKTVYDEPINKPKPLGMKLPDVNRGISQKHMYGEIPPVKVYELNIGMGLKSYEELVREWKYSLTLTGLYEDETDVENDVEASIRTKQNVTRFPMQDLTFFVRDSDGKCSLPLEELMRCNFLPMDGLEYSLLGLKAFVESQNNRARYAPIFHRLSDRYLEYELRARGIGASMRTARATAQELNIAITRDPIDIDGLRDAKRVAPILSGVSLPGNISLGNITFAIKSVRFSKEAMKFLSTLPPQDLAKVMENVEAKPFTDQNDNLQYLLLKGQYLGFAEPAALRNDPNASLARIRAIYEGIPHFGPLMVRYAEVSEYLRSGVDVTLLTEKEATGADDFWDTVNPEVPRSVMAFDYLNFTNVHDSAACPRRPAEGYSNEMMYRIAELYGYSQQIRVHTPASFLEMMSSESRDREMERALAVTLSGRNLEDMRRWVIGENDVAKLQEIAKNPQLYMGLIMGRPAPDYSTINYFDANLLSQVLSSVTDEEIKGNYSISEWQGRGEALTEIMNMARDTVTWRYFNDSSVLCNNGAVDLWGINRVGQPQISVGSLNNLTCLTLFELILGLLDEEPNELNRALTHVTVHNPTHITVRPSNERSYEIKMQSDVFYSQPGEYVLTPTYAHIREDYPETRRMNPDSTRSLQALLKKRELFMVDDGLPDIHVAASRLVDQLVEDFNDPQKQSVLAGVGFNDYFNSKTANVKESILKILAAAFVMGMMSRFWLTPAQVGNVGGFPLTIADLGGEEQTNQAITLRDDALVIFTDFIIRPYIGAVGDLGNNMVMVRAAKQDLLAGNVKLIKMSLLQTITRSMTADLCVKDLSDRLISTSWYYYAKLGLADPFQIMVERFYPQIRDTFNGIANRPYTLPQQLPQFDINRFQITRHEDPHHRQ